MLLAEGHDEGHDEGRRERKKKERKNKTPLLLLTCFSPTSLDVVIIAHQRLHPFQSRPHAPPPPPPGSQPVAPQPQKAKVTTRLSFFITSEINGDALQAGGKKNLYGSPSSAPTPRPPSTLHPSPLEFRTRQKKKRKSSTVSHGVLLLERRMSRNLKAAYF